MTAVDFFESRVNVATSGMVKSRPRDMTYRQLRVARVGTAPSSRSWQRVSALDQITSKYK